MKFKTILPLIFAALVVQVPADDKPAKPALKDDKDKASYSIGVDIAKSLKHDGVDVNLDALLAGLRDSYTGAPTLLTPEQQEEALSNLQKAVVAKRIADQAEVGAKAKKAGEDFLAANKGKDGVKTLPDGLQYKVLTEGKGAQPKPDSKVTVNYSGKLIDGTEFDSSYKRGEPTTFGVNEVIKGWGEAIPLMKIGSKWQIFIPSELAYGEKGVQGAIPPNSVLIFEVELLDVK
jgi:FKBP-type peptidyl-prolyl cis-trans isomerase FklB